MSGHSLPAPLPLPRPLELLRSLCCRKMHGENVCRVLVWPLHCRSIRFMYNLRSRRQGMAGDRAALRQDLLGSLRPLQLAVPRTGQFPAGYGDSRRISSPVTLGTGSPGFHAQGEEPSAALLSIPLHVSLSPQPLRRAWQARGPPSLIICWNSLSLSWFFV